MTRLTVVSRRPTRFAAAAGVFGVLVLTAGCSGGSSGSATSPQVASVADPSTTTASTATTVDDNARPLDRPDTTRAEQDRMYSAYWNCLISNGIPKAPKGSKPMDDGSARYAPARKACAEKEPEDWQDRLSRQHPEEYQDKARAWVNCMHAKGAKFTPSTTDDPTEVSYPDDADVPRMLDLASECTEKAFKVDITAG